MNRGLLWSIHSSFVVVNIYIGGIIIIVCYLPYSAKRVCVQNQCVQVQVDVLWQIDICFMWPNDRIRQTHRNYQGIFFCAVYLNH